MSDHVLRQDNDSHWYLLPLTLANVFDYNLEHHSDDPDIQFGDFRMIGGPETLILEKWREE